MLFQHSVVLRAGDRQVDGGRTARIVGHEVSHVNRGTVVGGRYGNQQHQQLSA